MYALDFEYDGQYLSDYGFIVCTFDYSSGANAVNAGSRITFNTTKRNSGKNNSLSGTNYDETISCQFDICKDPNLHDDLTVTEDEFRELFRWLNRREFLPFRAVDDEKDNEVCYFDASFNIERIVIAEVLKGLRLTMTTDKPFGRGQRVRLKWDIDDTGKNYVISDISDEIGHIRPDMKIQCKVDGDLEITNDLEECTMKIKNCKAGEVITVFGSEMVIESSYSEHKLWNDFVGFEFLRIGNTYNNRANKLRVSLPCVLEISYDPIIKSVPN